MKFEVNVFAWIPHPEVPNPIASLPGGVSRWGPGASGPYFGGDNFQYPSPKAIGADGMISRTFRAKQQLKFDASNWGVVSDIYKTGVVPGVTTVLTDTRRNGGRVCHSMTASVLKSYSSVTFVENKSWYEIVMRGKAQDPVPGAVGEHVLGVPGEVGANLITPGLEWDLTLRLSSGSEIGFWTNAKYKADAPFGLDNSASLVGAKTSLSGGSSSLAHGVITVRRYPSYAVYLTLHTSEGKRHTEIIFFADAMDRNLLTIAVSQDSKIRQVTF